MDKGEHQRRTKSVLLSSTKRKGLSQRVQMLTQEVKQGPLKDQRYYGSDSERNHLKRKENFLFKEATKGEA